jgi:Transcriptional regulator, AbiEi antitoxin
MEVAELARSQHGVVSRRQLLERGVGPGAIKHWLRTGRLHLLHHGVYAVGHAAVSPKGRLLAAVLACGDGALASHRSAAWRWELLPAPGGPADVTLPGTSRRGPRGVRLHRARHLTPEDRSRKEGIPLTSVARTVLDMAAILSRRRLERMLERCDRLRLFDRAALERVCAAYPGHRGATALAALIAAFQGAPDARSDLERDFLDFCDDHGLPRPAFNTVVEGHLVDARWPGHSLVVELDSWDFHRDRATFESDRRRDADLLVAGHPVLRVTSRRLKGEPLDLAGTVRSLLEE